MTEMYPEQAAGVEEYAASAQSDTPSQQLSSNLALWMAYAQPPGQYMRALPGSAGLTSVNAYWEIQCATEQWGPMGGAWGLRIEKIEPLLCGAYHTLFCQAHLYYPDPATNEESRVMVCDLVQTVWVNDRGESRLDADAPKKLLTGLISKALSYLGFSCAVYLSGKGHSTKYDQPGQQNVQAPPQQPTGARVGQPQQPQQPPQAQGAPRQGAGDGLPSCPSCGGPTRRREGTRGPFYGCQQYPRCRGIVDIIV